MRDPRRLLLAPLTLVLLAGCSSAAAPSTPVPATASASSAAAPSTASSPSSPTSSATDASTSYTMSDVAEHDTAEDCWAAIDGGVYDLTSWISRHPGGPDKIEPLCGTDATQKFRTQHDSQEKPNNQLASFRIGELSD
jgi:cytochrome b involved in lipid metabolism